MAYLRLKVKFCRFWRVEGDVVDAWFHGPGNNNKAAELNGGGEEGSGKSNEVGPTPTDH